MVLSSLHTTLVRYFISDSYWASNTVCLCAGIVSMCLSYPLTVLTVLCASGLSLKFVSNKWSDSMNVMHVYVCIRN
ncbi:hypothetical protein HanPI659440_Chr08g0301821 [Helianthus annuus]|nr:hypothetical protein HanPI659440_Chr08g0301821 [Helianthus annuus]